ncbi:MAG: hypothetical protein VX642_08990 [Bdellovibrionota bacterium]|nr:hypothetical protein [Bdellovibrionota bacterium]
MGDLKGISRDDITEPELSYKIVRDSEQEAISHTLPISWKVIFDQTLADSDDIRERIQISDSSASFEVEEILEGLEYKVHVYESNFSNLNLEVNTEGLKSQNGKSFGGVASQSDPVNYKRPFESKGSTYLTSIVPKPALAKLRYNGYKDGKLILANSSVTERFVVTDGTRKGSKYVSKEKITEINQSIAGMYLQIFDDPENANKSKLVKASDPYSNDYEVLYDFNVVRAFRWRRNSSPQRSRGDAFFLFNSQIFFMAVHTDGYLYLWKTDGTSAGTIRLFQMSEVVLSDTYLTASFQFYNENYFLMDVSTSELGANWFISDGTALGTEFMGDTRTGTLSHISDGVLREINGSFLYQGSSDDGSGCFYIKDKVINKDPITKCGVWGSFAGGVVKAAGRLYWLNNNRTLYSFDGNSVRSEGLTTATWIGKLSNGNLIIFEADKIYQIPASGGSPTEIYDFSTSLDTIYNPVVFRNKVVFSAINASLGNELYMMDTDGTVSLVEDFNSGTDSTYDSGSKWFGEVIGDYFYNYASIAGVVNIIKMDYSGNVVKIPLASSFELSTNNIQSPAFWEVGGNVLTTASNSDVANDLFRVNTDNTIEPIMNTRLTTSNSISWGDNSIDANYVVFVANELNGEAIYSFNVITNETVNLSAPVSSPGATDVTYLYYSEREKIWFFSVTDKFYRDKLYLTDGSLTGTREITTFGNPNHFEVFGETKDYYYIYAIDSEPVFDRFIYSVDKASLNATKLSQVRAPQISTPSWRSYDLDYDTNRVVFGDTSDRPAITDGTPAGTKSLHPSSGSYSISNVDPSVMISSNNIFILTNWELLKIDPSDVENPIDVTTLVTGYSTPRVSTDSVVMLKDRVVFLIYDGATGEGEYYSHDGNSLVKLSDPTAGLGNDYSYSNTYVRNPLHSDFHKGFGYISNWMAVNTNFLDYNHSASPVLTPGVLVAKPVCDAIKNRCVYYDATNVFLGDLDLTQVEDWGVVPGGVSVLSVADDRAAVVRSSAGAYYCASNDGIESLGTNLAGLNAVSIEDSNFIFYGYENDHYVIYKVSCGSSSNISKIGNFEEKNVQPSKELFLKNKAIISYNGKNYVLDY